VGRFSASPPKSDLYQRLSVRLSSDHPWWRREKGKTVPRPWKKEIPLWEGKHWATMAPSLRSLLCGCLLWALRETAGKDSNQAFKWEKGGIKGIDW